MIPYVIQVFRIKSIPGSIPYQPGAGGASGGIPALGILWSDASGFQWNDGTYVLWPV